MRKILRFWQKTVIVGFITLFILAQGLPAWAEIPSASSAPSAPQAPETTTVESATSSEAPSAPEAPTAPESPTSEETVESAPTSTPEPQPEGDQDESETTNDNEDGVLGEDSSPGGITTGSESPTEDGTVDNTGVVADGNVGDTEIETGDAETTGNVLTSGNTNMLAEPCLGCSPSGATVINSGNGEGSDNSGSATITNDNATLQDNTAAVVNNLEQSASTGDNSASKNVGDSTIETGDAATSATVLTAVNTNIDGVALSEFNVVDDHIGDLILDFGSNCISGCGNLTGEATVKNEDNGAGSQNDAQLEETTNNNTFQNNDATIENNLVLASDSGNNTASKNTGGSSTIETGDASTVANVLTFLNNNLAGNVVLGVVNIFGDLIGDIILPEGELAGCGNCQGSDVNVANVGNGSDSTNDASVDETTNNTTFQTNEATIENNLLLAATSGGNEASKNTDGSSSITTGDSSVMAQVLNVANSNLAGGTWWLVLVNEAGQWLGRILGAPEGSNFAGSEGTEFIVDENGEITAVNSGNGSGSTNTASASQTTNNTTTQENTAHVVNNLDLSANTGGNETSKNTGGSSTIETGDARVVANLINFVNNNISGGGKLVVTVVNVFGSWIGDFVTPGNAKEDSPNEAFLASNQENSPADSSGGDESEDQNTPNVGNPPSLPSVNSSQTDTDDSDDPASTTTTTVYAVFSSLMPPSTTVDAQTAVSQIPPQENYFAGFSEKENEGKVGGTRQMNINLAWIILTVPLLALLIVGKRIGLLKILLRRG